MSLFNIKDKLYKKDEPKNISEHEITPYDPAATPAGVNIPAENDLWVSKEGGLVREEKQKITTGLKALIIVLAVILSMAIIFEIRRAAFDSRNAHVSVVGPEQSKSGQTVTYEINYKNNNWVGMKNAAIKISYPEEFKPEQNKNFKEETPTSGTYFIGAVLLRSSGKISFSGKAYSPKGALMYLRANLTYQPAVLFGHFETAGQLGINIVPAPLTFEVEGPQDLVSGNALDYSISYRNDGEEDISGLQIVAQYPEGFKFLSAVPASGKNNAMWDIGNLKAGDSGKLIIRGQLDGGNGINRAAKISIGLMDNGEFVSYNDETVNTRMVSSPLLIAQEVNGKQQATASAGEYLGFKITYKNNGNIGLRDVIVTEKLDSPVLDYATLDIKNGSFDQEKKIITWKVPDVKAFKNLNPGDSGELNFSIKVKENIPLDGDVKKNFVITSLAKIDSPDVPTPIAANKIISSNSLDLKLNSKIILETLGFYYDAKIPNTGPIPPKVGQETTYTLHWKAMNVSNDINNVTVMAHLPTNATMTGRIFPDDARLDYNARANVITWNIGKMDAGEGLLSSPPEVAFQVKIKPSPDQVKREVGLLGESTLTAKDLFSGEDLTVVSNAKTINLSEDKKLVGAGGDRVVD